MKKLPAFALLFGLLASPVPALETADVEGYWTFAADYGEGYLQRFETRILGDGSYEMRIRSMGEADTQIVDRFGTWVLAGDTLIERPSERCKLQGIGPETCDTAAIALSIEAMEGGTAMVDSRGHSVGAFRGATAFTVPDLFADAILRRAPARKAAAGPSLIFASGSDWPRRIGAGAFSDISGRVSGSRMAAGIRIRIAAQP